MTAVFVDTVGLLALWDEADQWHVAAANAFAGIIQRRASLVTTTFVLLECGNASARRPYRNEADDLRRLLERRNELIDPTAADWQDAWKSYRRDEFGGAGIVDCISIVVMRRLGLNEVFTNDRHFKAAGLQVLF